MGPFEKLTCLTWANAHTGLSHKAGIYHPEAVKILDLTPHAQCHESRKSKDVHKSAEPALSDQGFIGSFSHQERLKRWGPVTRLINRSLCVLSHFNRLFATLWTIAPSPNPRLLCPRDSTGKNTGVGCMPTSRGSSLSGDWTHLSYVSCIGRQVLYH